MDTANETPFREERKLVNGVRCMFESHIQTHYGTGTMANTHYHDYIEILYCLNGLIRIFLDGKSYEFAKGDMILINSNEIHTITALGETNQYMVVKFQPEILYTTTQTVFEAKYLMPFTMSHSTNQKLFPHEEIKDTFIPEALTEIHREYQNKEYGFELAIRTHICRIFLWILRSWNARGTNIKEGDILSDSTIEWLQKVFDYVQTEYQNPISVAEVAELCNMSYHYFSRKFKSIMKKSFSEYLNYFRISQAEKLLMTSDLNITEIAFEVGFSTSSYFIEQFKIYKDISPKKFRSSLFDTAG